MKIISFNTGSGDHTIVEFPNGELGVVDFHYQENLFQTFPPAINYVSKILEERNSVTFSFICLTHYDTDHIKGFDKFFKYIYDQRSTGKEIIIKNIWLAGGKGLNEFNFLIGKKLKEFKKHIYKLDQPKDKESLNKKIENLETQLEKYEYRFRRIEYHINRWEKETDLKREYLFEIRPITFDHIAERFRAYSIAPLQEHIEKYNKTNFMATIDALIRGKRSNSYADRNLISSVFFLEDDFFEENETESGRLRICFGGDTHKDIWISSIQKLGHNKDYQLSSSFVKVSHHGSEHSSDSLIWDSLISDSGNTYFCICAGNRSYGKGQKVHPSEKTLSDINNCCAKHSLKPNIYSTNVCCGCKLEPSNGYNTSIDKSQLYHKKKEIKSRTAKIVFRSLRSKAYRSIGTKRSTVGLAALIFDINISTNEVAASAAISESIPAQNCIFSNKTYGLHTDCLCK